MPGIAAIVLAAGASTRMGRPKQLLPVGGRPMLTLAVDAARAAGCEPTVVVLGRDAEACRTLVDRDDTVTIFNSGWQRGMGTSLRAGAQSLPADASAAFVLLADQPAVTVETLARLRAAATDAGRPVAVASYAGTVGPPVFVSGATLNLLRNWPDDHGAKALWLERADDVVRVECPEAAGDVDTPQDYERVSDGERR